MVLTNDKTFPGTSLVSVFATSGLPCAPEIVFVTKKLAEISNAVGETLALDDVCSFSSEYKPSFSGLMLRFPLRGFSKRIVQKSSSLIALRYYAKKQQEKRMIGKEHLRLFDQLQD